LHAVVRAGRAYCASLLYPATSEREKISFHQLNKETGNRIRYRKVDAETGDDVEQANIIKGYELAKGEYVDVTREELEAVAIESRRTIEIELFVPKTQIDELYIRDPYYIAPDGEVGQQAFAVIREAIRKEGMVAVGKVVFTHGSTSLRSKKTAFNDTGNAKRKGPPTWRPTLKPSDAIAQETRSTAPHCSSAIDATQSIVATSRPTPSVDVTTRKLHNSPI
jgi:hypothetical protein